MTAMDCGRLTELAPELALEILTGDERASAIAHLGHCASCQELVSSLAGSVDRLLLLAPGATPPVGFEQRVLAAIIPRQIVPRPARRRTRRPVLAAAVAVAACVVLIAVAFGSGGPERPAVAAAEMRTPTGDVVGHVVLGPDDPVTMLVTLPGWAVQIADYAAGVAYELRIELDDGPPQTMPMTIDGDSTWAVDLEVSPDSITSVAVVDDQGNVWCHAEL